MNPKCRVRTNPCGSTCNKNRRMNSSAERVILRFLVAVSIVPPTEGDLIAIERNQSTYQKMPTLVLYELGLSGHSPVHRHRPTVLRARTLRPKRRTYATTDRVL